MDPRKFYDNGEDWPARICTCPSIAQCLVAMPKPPENKNGELFVYFTEVEEDSFTHGLEWDTEITEEKWILKSSTFVLLDTFKDDVYSWVGETIYDPWDMGTFLDPTAQISLLKIKLAATKRFLYTMANYRG